MKMGATASPSRYDAGLCNAPKQLRRDCDLALRMTAAYLPDLSER
jgi:hypothetical protein